MWNNWAQLTMPTIDNRLKISRSIFVLLSGSIAKDWRDWLLPIKKFPPTLWIWILCTKIMPSVRCFSFHLLHIFQRALTFFSFIDCKIGYHILGVPFFITKSTNVSKSVEQDTDSKLKMKYRQKINVSKLSFRDKFKCRSYFWNGKFLSAALQKFPLYTCKLSQENFHRPINVILFIIVVLLL